MSDLEKKILDQIDKRGLVPRPYIYFFARRSVFWTLAILSVALGAISMAVIVHGVVDYLAAGEPDIDEIPFEDLFETLPFVWLGLLTLFIVSALFSMHKTARGFRYRASHIVVFAVVASAILGSLLHYFDIGKRTHRYLNRHVSSYEKLVRSREDYWSVPDKGKLGGRVLAVDQDQSLTLRDFRGGEWTVDIAGAKITLSESLLEEGIVGIQGVRTGPTSFRALSIEEWD